MALIDIYHQRLHNSLHELLERTHHGQKNIIVRKSSGVAAGFTPASTSEEVAMQAVELSSRARTIEEISFLVAETYRSLFKRENDSESE